MPIIEVNNVTKEYRLGQMKSLKQSFLRNMDRLRGRAVPKQEPFFSSPKIRAWEDNL